MSTSVLSSSIVNFMPVSFRNARRHFLAMSDTCAVIPPPSLCVGHLHTRPSTRPYKHPSPPQGLLTRPSTRPYKHPSPPQGLLPGSIARCNDAGLIPLRSGCVRQGFRFAHSPPRPSMLARKVRARSRIARRSAMLFPILSRSEEHTSTPVTNAHLVCRLLLEHKKTL